MKVFAVVGSSETGKTRLIQNLIPELKKRGYSVAVIKHCPHGFEMDHGRKDSSKFVRAGSDGVALISPKQLAVFQMEGGPADFQAIAREYFKNFDFVMVEGGKTDPNLKKIEVLRKGVAEKLECSPPELIAVVSEEPVETSRPVFSPDKIVEIADFLEYKFEEKEPPVVLELDGEPVPLNPFVQKVFENLVVGVVKSLKGIKKDSKNLNLTIRRSQSKNE